MKMSPPPELDCAALLEFHRTCAAMGARLTEEHRTLITLHSMAWAIWQNAQRHIDAEGVVVTANGARVVNPFFETYTDSAEMILVTLNALGLTPMSRAAMGIESDGIAPGDDGDE